MDARVEQRPPQLEEGHGIPRRERRACSRHEHDLGWTLGAPLDRRRLGQRLEIAARQRVPVVVRDLDAGAVQLAVLLDHAAKDRGVDDHEAMARELEIEGVGHDGTARAPTRPRR